MRKQNNFKPGDLVRVVRADGWSLCQSPSSALTLREMPMNQPKFGMSEGDCRSLVDTIALITKVNKNKLEQVVSYRIETEGLHLLCKSILAEKYFEKVEE